MEHGNYQDIAEMEEHNWWYCSRRELFAGMLRSFKTPVRVALDIGCGVGANYRILRHAAERVIGVDPASEAYVLAGKKGYDQVFQASAEQLPLPDASVDLILCADVLEHVDDVATLRELFRVLVPGGTLLLSVPAFPSLWNANDIYSQHRRRYTKSACYTALRAPGFVVSRSTFWNALFFLPVWCVARWQQWRPVAKEQLQNNLSFLPRWLDRVLLRLLCLENAWILRGHHFPFGVTLVVSAKKPSTHSL